MKNHCLKLRKLDSTATIYRRKFFFRHRTYRKTFNEQPFALSQIPNAGNQTRRRPSLEKWRCASTALFLFPMQPEQTNTISAANVRALTFKTKVHERLSRRSAPGKAVTHRRNNPTERVTTTSPRRAMINWRLPE